jgi:hypothetical protein
MSSLAALLPDPPDDEAILDAFTSWAEGEGLTLYPAQEEAILEVLAGANVILATPTGSGKSLVALGAHATALARGQRSWYTAPIKALVSEKFFSLCRQLGSDNVGMLTGDAAVNPGAPVICCTAEVLANLALRQGATAPVDQVVMDEFHFYADPSRGWAWQVPLLELPRAQFVLMSATLGDVSGLQRDLTARTGRPTVHVTSATRPVPLDYSFRHTPLHQTIDDLLATGAAPVYVVHFTQASAVERAQSLMSVNVCSREEKDAISRAIGGFRFSPGFGRSLSRFVRHGIGVHHAGMLPKYRLLVERLAQEGHLKVICGTDTLGVGINVPIRTVVFTQLAKYDGTSSRLLDPREFHQIAGRAGRAGFDDAGSVVVQAPEHVIANEVALAKAGEDPKKRRKVVRSKPPKGFVAWSQDTFDRLVVAPPGRLGSSFTISHAMVLNVLDRPGDGCAALRRLLLDNHEPRAVQRRLIRRAIGIYRSLLAAGVVERLDEPDGEGRTVRVTVDLQSDFALNQALSPFVLEALPHLDPESESYALDVLSIVESTLDNPKNILAAQLDRLKGDLIAELKMQGVEYDQRMEALEKVEHPKPLRELTYDLFDAYRLVHPWAADHNIAPKSVARDLYEQAMDFTEYVAHYKVARSEGLLLRYLTDAYKGLAQSVPEDYRSDAVVELTEWLGELVRQVDSSLLDEWERLRHPDEADGAGADAAGAVADGIEGLAAQPISAIGGAPPVTRNARAFRVMVRNQAFRRIELLATKRWEDLGDLDGESGWTTEHWFVEATPYFDEHGRLGSGPDARRGELFQVDEEAGGIGRWLVRQVLDDPEGHHDWVLELEIDLAASDELGAAVARPLALRQVT